MREEGEYRLEGGESLRFVRAGKGLELQMDSTRTGTLPPRTIFYPTGETSFQSFSLQSSAEARLEFIAESGAVHLKWGKKTLKGVRIPAPRQPHGWRELRHRLFKINVELDWFAHHALGEEYEWEKAPED